VLTRLLALHYYYNHYNCCFIVVLLFLLFYYYYRFLAVVRARSAFINSISKPNHCISSPPWRTREFLVLAPAHSRACTDSRISMSRAEYLCSPSSNPDARAPGTHRELVHDTRKISIKTARVAGTRTTVHKRAEQPDLGGLDIPEPNA
jgi:hypothetical protein